MTSVQPRVVTTSAVQGELWGARSRDWAELIETAMRPLFEAVLRRSTIGKRTRVLDAGCGSGLFLKLAAARGAVVSGLDASTSLLAIARERVPAAYLRVGEIEELPYDDMSFDVVTGFNSFQYAAQPVNALREARRVKAPGAPLFIATWGREDDCEAAGYFAALRANLPTPPAGAPGPFALSEPGALEGLVRDAGLVPTDDVTVNCRWEFADLDTALRGLLSLGPAVRAARHTGAPQLRRDIARRSLRSARRAAVTRSKTRSVT